MLCITSRGLGKSPIQFLNNFKITLVDIYSKFCEKSMLLKADVWIFHQFFFLYIILKGYRLYHIITAFLYFFLHIFALCCLSPDLYTHTHACHLFKNSQKTLYTTHIQKKKCPVLYDVSFLKYLNIAWYVLKCSQVTARSTNIPIYP